MSIFRFGRKHFSCFSTVYLNAEHYAKLCKRAVLDVVQLVDIYAVIPIILKFKFVFR